MKSILLVEDGLFMNVMKAVLHDYELTCVSSMEETKAALRERTLFGKKRFSLIVLDLDLPDSSIEKTVEQIPEIIKLGNGARLLVVSGFDIPPIPGTIDAFSKLENNFVEKLPNLVRDLTS